MTAIEQLAIETALRKMFSQGHFSICTIDAIIKMTNVVPDKRLHQTLSLLHCVDYNAMPAEILQALPGMVRDILGGPEIDIDALFKRPAPRQEIRIFDVTPAPVAKRGLLRLFK